MVVTSGGNHQSMYGWELGGIHPTGMLPCYQPQGKVMFSETSVCSQGGRQNLHSLEKDPPFGGRTPPPGDRPPLERETPSAPLVLTSSSGHCSSQYASYCNAFLLV